MLNHRLTGYFVVLITLLAMASCNPARRIGSEQYLLNKNELVVDNKDIDTYELGQILKQTPNRKTLIFRFHLSTFNTANPIKTQRKIVKRQTKLGKRNMRRMQKGRDSLYYKPTFNEWLMYTVGEAPVVLDTAKVEKSVEQLSLYLTKKGYFNNVVRDTIVYNPRRQFAKVSYIINTGPAKKIKKLQYFVKDATLKSELDKAILEGKDQYEPVIRAGDNLDIYALDDERNQLAEQLRNNGYWKITPDVITYNADTTQAKDSAVVTMTINDRLAKSPMYEDSVITYSHRPWKIKTVTFVMDYNPAEGLNAPRKSLVHMGPQGRPHTILYKDTVKIDPNVLIQSTFLRPDGYWKEKYVERTHKRFNDLNLFNGINIRFRPDEERPNDQMHVTFLLTPKKQKAFSLEANGTNKGGFLGIAGNVNFNNNNAFGGGENLTIGLQGGIEAQQTITDSNEDDEGSNNVSLGNGSAFNTVEFGPQVSLKIPKFLFIPISLEKLSRSAMPFTSIEGQVNFQNRPDYVRNLINASFAYEWWQTKTIRHRFAPIDFSEIKIDRSSEFDARINELNDLLLRASYSDHLIIGSVYSRTYNSELSDKVLNRKNKYLYQFNFEWAGNLLRALHNLQGREQNADGGYEIANITYAQYVKMDHDFQYKRKFNTRHSLATRVKAGVGLPLQNLQVLPFEKSFFVGGANGLRAWKARSLGPGSFYDPNRGFDKIGDIRLESTIEYRFNLIGLVEGAFFADAGNIWMIQNDEVRAGGQFDLTTFHKQVAVGGGFGTRLNFGFFIIRLDAAIPLKDPALPAGERWIWEPQGCFSNLGKWRSKPLQHQTSI